MSQSSGPQEFVPIKTRDITRRPNAKSPRAPSVMATIQTSCVLSRPSTPQVVLEYLCVAT